MRRILPILIGAAIGLGAAVPAAPAAMSTYDFEGLTSNSNLAGQDNWVFRSTNYIEVTEVVAGNGSNTTKVASQPITANANYSESRVNDGNFSYPAFSNTETQAIFEFDYLDEKGTAYFGVGYDGGDSSFTLGEIALWFGVSNLNVELEQPSGVGADNYSVAFINRGVTGNQGDWYTIRLEADFVADTGTFYYKNLTQNDPSFTLIGTATNLLVGSAPYNSGPTSLPATWNSMYLIMYGGGGNGPTQVDNLRLGTEEIPEPASVTLLAVSAVLLLKRSKDGRVAL